MSKGHWSKLYKLIAGLSLTFILPNTLYAAEISAFKITDTDGYFGLRYRYDNEVTDHTPNPQISETRTVFDEELYMKAGGYIYHPNFLKINLGAGILLSQENIKSVSSNIDHDDTLYNLNANLNFLEKKPYPFSLYYNKSHPTVSVNVTDVYVQENEKYGMRFSLRKPISPILLNIEAYEQSSTGDSFTQVVDDTTNFQRIRASSGLSNGGNIQLTHTRNQKESLSGSKSASIQPFNLTTNITDLNSKIIFGMKQDVTFNLTASQTTQEQDRDLQEFRFSPNLNWDHSKYLNSYYRYSLFNRKQSGYENNDSSGAAGARYKWNENLFANAEIHYANNDATGLKLNNMGARAAVTYKQQLAIGLLQFNLGLNLNNYDREASNVVQVVNANYTLSGNNPVTLGHDYIDTATIIVKRTDTNQTLIEGLGNDYIVTVVGKQTQIQKVNPALPVNLDVLVSYEYDPGGSATYGTVGQNFQTSLKINKSVTAFVNYRDTQYNLKSGAPTLTLDSSDTTSYGVRVDYRFPTDIEFSLGGEVLNEKHNEKLSSYIKNSADIFMQVAMPLSSTLYMSLRRLTVDNIYSNEDINLTGYILRLKSNPAERLSVSLQLSDDKNSGGSLDRHNRNISLTSQWRVRKLLLGFGARQITETQGSITHQQTIINATLKRQF